MLEQVHPEILPDAHAAAGDIAADTGEFMLGIIMQKWLLTACRPSAVTNR
jgi:hypothetical protein